MDINKLLKEMTLEEKVGQLVQIFDGEFVDRHHQQDNFRQCNLAGDKIYTVGSISGAKGAVSAYNIQKDYLENSRLKIPLLFMLDVIHGYETNFPIALGFGASFNPKLVSKAIKMSAHEARVAGTSVTYSPMADMTYDPRWGRMMENTGEDVYLNKLYTSTIVEAFQGDMNLLNNGIGACVKHFIGYGYGEGGRDYATSDFSKLELYNKILPQFKTAIDSNVQLVMCAFNTVDGIPCTANKDLLRNLLRKELGFNGVIISDHSSIQELITHGVARDLRECAKLSIEAGVDIELATKSYSTHLQELVESGDIDIKLVDDAVYRVLKLKENLGLFANPFYMLPDEEKNILGNVYHQKIAYDIACESIVLLENPNNMLPLNKSEKVLFLGPVLEEKNTIGFNACAVDYDQTVTIYDALLSKEFNCHTFTGINFNNINDELINQLTKEVKLYDKVVLCLGEYSRQSGEGIARTDITLDEKQLSLLKAVHVVNPNVIVTVQAGRPLDLQAVNKLNVPILYTWLLGSQSGNAIVDTIYGLNNPSGKTTVSFPLSVGQIPVYYNHLNTGRPKLHEDQEYVTGYVDATMKARYPFGYGLSYSEFEFDNIEVSLDADQVKVNLDVSNKSDVDGCEVVQVYVQDVYASISRPVKELKGFKKINIKAMSTVHVEIIIDVEQLGFYNAQGVYLIEPGEFNVYVGNSSVNCIKKIINYSGVL
jgi:beta-glucosidase